MIESPKTITIDGVEHTVADLPPAVGALVSVHTRWANELADARYEVAKTEAAIRQVEAEIVRAVKASTEPAEAPAAEAPAAE